MTRISGFEHARKRAELLHQAAADARAIMRDRRDEVTSLRKHRNSIQAELSRLLERRAAGAASISEETITELETKIAAATNQMADRSKRLEEYSSRMNGLCALAERAKRFVDENPKLKVMPPLANRGDTISSLRQRRKDIRKEINRVEYLFVPAAEAKTEMRLQVAEIAHAGRPDVSPLIEDMSAAIKWPSKIVDGRTQVDVLSTFVWLNEANLIKKMEAEIDELAEESSAISAEDRASKISALQSELFDCERQECDLIWASGDLTEFQTLQSVEAVLAVTVQ